MAVTLDVHRVVDIPAGASRGRSDAWLIGLFAFGVSVVGAGRPSLWVDEAATISVSTRPLRDMWTLLGHVDAVHGLYYLLMHGWLTLFPATEFWARMPSALLIGGAAGGVVVLVRQLSTRSVAIASGMAFAVLPRTTWAGIEARSYALSMFDAVWVTVLVVAALRRDRTSIWICYAVALALATVGNVFVLFVVAAHAVVVIGIGRSRRTTVAWFGAVVAAIIAIAPFLGLTKSQQSQVDWIWPVGPGTIGQVLGDQYFPPVYSGNVRVTGLDSRQQVSPEQVWAALHAWALVVPFIVVLVAVVIAAVRMRGQPGAPTGGDTRVLAWAAAAWIVAPTALLIGYSVVREPLYQPHYLSFTVPGLAILMGLCVVTVCRDRRRITIVLAVLAAAALPNQLAQRGPYAKFGQDYSRVADVIGTHAAPNDCLDVDDTLPLSLAKALKVGRPDAYARLRDDGLNGSAIERSSIFESRVPVTQWSTQLRTCPALWTVTVRDSSLPAHERGEALAPGPRLEPTAAYRVPTRLGFRIVERWQFNLTQVLRSVRLTR